MIINNGKQYKECSVGVTNNIKRANGAPLKTNTTQKIYCEVKDEGTSTGIKVPELPKEGSTSGRF